LAAAPKCADSSLPTLKFAEQDVSRLAELLSRSGYRAEKIVHLAPESARRDEELAPTRRNFLKQLSAIAARATEDDLLLIGLSGHGVQARIDGVDQPCFCPADGSPKAPQSLLSLQQLVAHVEGLCRAKRIVLVVDACRTRQGDVEGARLPELPARWFAYWSCSAGEAAYEDPRVQHGVFPHLLIEGLRGSADASGDGRITTLELESFVTGRTSKHVKDWLGKSQTPEFTGAIDDSTAIVER
jgi:uncharacterized caspase-like protein